MVSVCMATKNGGRYLKEQMDSILAQLSEKDEVIVSDDKSTDDTVTILNSYNDSRIKVLQNELPKGVTQNFENALRNCVGDYVFLSDQDDVWFPEKIETMVKSLQVADLVISDCVITDDDLTELHRSFFALNKSGGGIIKNLFSNSYMGCCMAFRNTVLKRALPFPPKTPIHDFWIGLVAARHFKVTFLKMPLMYHRRHSNNASSTARSSTQLLSSKLKIRFSLVRNILINRAYVS